MQENNKLNEKQLEKTCGGESNTLKAHIDEDFCVCCGVCAEVCPINCIDFVAKKINANCTGCGICAGNCPNGAIFLE